MEDLGKLLARIETFTALVRRSSGDPGLLAEIEDVLSEGYASALAGEARMFKLEERLDDLLDSGDESRARELRLIVREHRAAERSVATLRSALAGLHSEFVALGGARLLAL
jgi:hypothetical protein